MRDRERYLHAVADVMQHLKDTRHSLERLLALPAPKNDRFSLSVHHVHGVEWSVQLALAVLEGCAPHDALCLTADR